MLLLKWLPAPAHRALYRAAHRLRVIVWRVRPPNVEGVRVLALDGQGRILLVRHSYGSGVWMPPGGGIHRGEEPLAAAARELLEETGCVLTGAHLVRTEDEPLHGGRNRANVIAGRAIGEPSPGKGEIVAARYFALDDLPLDEGGASLTKISDWLGDYR